MKKTLKALTFAALLAPVSAVVAGDEPWGYYEGEPYWSMGPCACERPFVSGGTLFMPAKQKKPETRADRVVENAVFGAGWAIESGINNTVDRLIYDLSSKIFKYN